MSSMHSYTKLVTAFHDTTLPHRFWGHQAHLIVCWSALRGMRAPEVVTRLRVAIRRYNDATGVPNTDDSGYHETLTLYCIHAVDQFRGPLQQVLDAKICSKHAPLDYWSRERLFSVRARREWLAPDLGSPTWLKSTCLDTESPGGYDGKL